MAKTPAAHTGLREKSLTHVVICDNMPGEQIREDRLRLADDAEDTARLVDRDGAQGIRGFPGKSTPGSRTPKREMDLVRHRLKRLKEMLP